MTVYYCTLQPDTRYHMYAKVLIRNVVSFSSNSHRYIRYRYSISLNNILCSAELEWGTPPSVGRTTRTLRNRADAYTQRRRRHAIS